MNALPKLRDDLVNSRQESAGRLFVVIKDPRTGRYFRVREPEFWLISQFDGRTDFDTIAERFEKKYRMQLPQGAVESLASRLYTNFFVETEGGAY